MYLRTIVFNYTKMDRNFSSSGYFDCSPQIESFIYLVEWKKKCKMRHDFINYESRSWKKCVRN